MLQSSPRAARARFTTIPRVALLVGALTVGALAVRPSRAADAPRSAAASKGAVWQHTYLKAHPGAPVDSLARVVTANWFAMDANAVASGDLEAYHLLRGTPADTTWDLLEIAVFRDSAQHARADSVYRTRYRPSHTPVLVGGRELRGWGRIVRTETLTYLAGGS